MFLMRIYYFRPQKVPSVKQEHRKRNFFHKKENFKKRDEKTETYFQKGIIYFLNNIQYLILIE